MNVSSFISGDIHGLIQVRRPQARVTKYMRNRVPLTPCQTIRIIARSTSTRKKRRSRNQRNLTYNPTQTDKQCKANQKEKEIRRIWIKVSKKLTSNWPTDAHFLCYLLLQLDKLLCKSFPSQTNCSSSAERIFSHFPQNPATKLHLLSSLSSRLLSNSRNTLYQCPHKTNLQPQAKGSL